MAVKTPDLFSFHSGCTEADQTEVSGSPSLGSSTDPSRNHTAPVCFNSEDFSRLPTQTFRITSIAQCRPLCSGEKAKYKMSKPQKERIGLGNNMFFKETHANSATLILERLKKCPGHNLPPTMSRWKDGLTSGYIWPNSKETEGCSYHSLEHTLNQPLTTSSSSPW